jgi:Zn-finger protein
MSSYRGFLLSWCFLDALYLPDAHLTFNLHKLKQRCAFCFCCLAAFVDSESYLSGQWGETQVHKLNPANDCCASLFALFFFSFKKYLTFLCKTHARAVDIVLSMLLVQRSRMMIGTPVFPCQRSWISESNENSNVWFVYKCRTCENIFWRHSFHEHFFLYNITKKRIFDIQPAEIPSS